MRSEANMAKILEALRVNVMGDLTLPALAQVINQKVVVQIPY